MSLKLGQKEVMEGNEAMAEAALLAGCRFYAGYPITPSTEILEHMAYRLPQVGGVYVHAETENEAINLCWGAAAGGARAMTASTGTGIALMQESFAELANAQVPVVVINMAREPSYRQVTRGGGHGDYHHIVLCPSGVQEAADLVQRAFYLADKYRTPVIILGDFVLGKTMESVVFNKLDESDLPPKAWAIGDGQGRGSRPVTFLGYQPGKTDVSVDAMLRAMEKHPTIKEREVLWETQHTDGADIIFVAYGTSGRFLKYAVHQARAAGAKVGFFRPISLWPFPENQLSDLAKRAKAIVVFETSAGQMIEDVYLSVQGQAPVHAFGVGKKGGAGKDGGSFGVSAELDVEYLEKRVMEYVRLVESGGR